MLLYSFRRASQNLFKSYDENCNFNVLSADNSIRWLQISTGILATITMFSSNGLRTYFFERLSNNLIFSGNSLEFRFVT